LKNDRTKNQLERTLINTFGADLLNQRKITNDIQEAIFCMDLNRLIEPTSKLGVDEWMDDTVYVLPLNLFNFIFSIVPLISYDENKEVVVYRGTEYYGFLILT